MSESSNITGLIYLGGGPQLEVDVIHALEAVDITAQGGEVVDIDSLWTNQRSVLVNSPDGIPILKSKDLSVEKALELADLQLSRLVLPDVQLVEHEIAVRTALIVAGMDFGAPIEQVNPGHREGLAESFRKLGGIAVLSGTNVGVHRAMGFYQDLRLLNH